MIWAAAAVGVYNLGLQEVNASLATGTIGVICKDIPGPCGRHHRSAGRYCSAHHLRRYRSALLRLSLSESCTWIRAPRPSAWACIRSVFALVAVIVVFVKFSPSGASTSCGVTSGPTRPCPCSFLAISVWMFENGKAKFGVDPLIPAAWYTFVTVTFIANAQIGFHIPWTPAYVIACLPLLWPMLASLSGTARSVLPPAERRSFRSSSPNIEKQPAARFAAGLFSALNLLPPNFK